jgi:hypothetical protein
VTTKQQTSEQLARQVTAGENVAALLEHPGYADLLLAAEAKARAMQKALMMRPVRESTAEYANELGFMRGLSEIPKLAESIVALGKQSAEKIHAREAHVG